MKKQIIDFWNTQYTLSGKGHFPKFLSLLAQGGGQATLFIDSNAGLIETVGGNADELKEAIRADAEADENKAWFFSEAMKKLSEVRAVLNNRFHPTMAFAQSLGVDTEGWSAGTIIPCINAIGATTEAGAGGGGCLILDHFAKTDVIKALKSVGVDIKGSAGKAAITAAIDALTDEDNAEFQKALGIETPEALEAPEVSEQTETLTDGALTDEDNADTTTTTEAGAGEGANEQ